MSEETTKDLADNLTERQLLLELRQAVGALAERMTELEKRTNPLPPNYDERFTAMEKQITALEKGQKRLEQQLHFIREDMFQQRTDQAFLEQRVEALEDKAA